MIRLTLATREQDTFEKAFAKQIEAFQKLRPDISVQIVTRPIHDHYTQLVQNDFAEECGVDILLCCTDWLPELVAKGRALPLEPFLQRDPPADWPHGWHPAMRSLQQFEGQTFGLPWHDGPQVFHTRKDLFQHPKEQADYKKLTGQDLRVPQTWSEFLQVAKFFTRPSEGLWGCCQAAYTDGHNNVYDFLIQLWSRGGQLFDQAWQPCFQQQEGVEALQFYADLFHTHKVAPPQCLDLGSVECGDFYAQGHAAMSWNWLGFAAVAELPQYSKIVGNNLCSKIPAGDGPKGRSVSLNIYWVLTILAHSPHPEAAYDFLKFVLQPEMDKITSLAGANGVRLSTWNDPEIRNLYPHYAIIEEVHQGTKTMPPIPEFTEINEELSLAVHQTVHERRPASESLGQAARACQNILAKSGRLR